MTKSSEPVPFFRVELGEQEIREVASVLRSGWLTTGPRVASFEARFAEAVGVTHALAVSSGTAAMHLAVEALGLAAGEGVLVPAMTFAATAEVVRYSGAVPILVDCEETSLNIDLADAERKLRAARRQELPVRGYDRVVGIMPVHVGGFMLRMDEVGRFAAENGLWIVEDAAHAFPAAFRTSEGKQWQICGAGTADVTCFSFYANKTITTGEGGMAVTEDQDLADRMRLMSLHGLSQDAWQRYSGGEWDYRIVAPGYKYNMTDIVGAIGLHQVRRAEEFRRRRERLSELYGEKLGGVEEVELPSTREDRIHAWHLYPIRLRLERLRIDRDEFMRELKAAGIGCSVHWRPLHRHPYYEEFGWGPDHCPIASRAWRRLISLPLFPSMSQFEIDRVVSVIRDLCRVHRRRC